MQNDIITAEDRAHLAQRYKVGGLGPEATIQYAIDTAHRYAATYCRDMPAFVHRIVAQLHVRYLIAGDRGTKLELRQAIDMMLEIGRGCANAR